MKITQYILRYTFVLGVTLTMSLVLGPALIKKALNPIEKELQMVKMQKIEVSYLNENTDRYIKAKFTFNNKTVKKIYFVPENEHIKLETFLCRNEFINSTSNICKLNKSTLPIFLTSQQLSKLPKPKVSIGKNDELEYLQFGEDLVIGKSSTLIGKVLLVLLGILFFVFGILLLFAATVYTFQNFRKYYQTGDLSSPPNTIDEMIKGFKLIFGKNNNRNYMSWKKYVVKNYLGEKGKYEDHKTIIREKIFKELISGNESETLGASKILIGLDNLHFTTNQVNEILLKCSNLPKSEHKAMRDYRQDVNAAVMLIKHFHNGAKCKCEVYKKWIQFLPEREIEIGYLSLIDGPIVNHEKYQMEYKLHCKICGTDWQVNRNDGYHYPWYEWIKK